MSQNTPDDVPTIIPNPVAGLTPTLGELASLGLEALTAALSRPLPGVVSGQVPVATFNSSI